MKTRALFLYVFDNRPQIRRLWIKISIYGRTGEHKRALCSTDSILVSCVCIVIHKAMDYFEQPNELRRWESWSLCTTSQCTRDTWSHIMFIGKLVHHRPTCLKVRLKKLFFQVSYVSNMVNQIVSLYPLPLNCQQASLVKPTTMKIIGLEVPLFLLPTVRPANALSPTPLSMGCAN